jgi:hypothetical protein
MELQHVTSAMSLPLLSPSSLASKGGDKRAKRIPAGNSEAISPGRRRCGIMLVLNYERHIVRNS